MKFSDIKNDIIAPHKQKVIDKKVQVDGKVFHVLCAYEQNDYVEIVTLNIGDTDDVDGENIDNLSLGNVKTKRDELVMIANAHRNTDISVEDFYIDNKKINMNSASSGGLYQNHYDFLKIGYIMSLGINLDYLDDVLLKNITVATHKTKDITLESLELDSAKVLRMTREPSRETILENIEYSLTLNVEEFSFIDKNGVEHKFTARLVEMDLWSEVPKLEEKYKEIYEKLSDEERETFETPNFDTIYEDVCPKGMNLLCVAYKSETQLNFYTKEDLEAEIKRDNKSSFMFMGDKETGERFSVLYHVEKNTVESMLVELFSWIKTTVHDDIIVNL